MTASFDRIMAPHGSARVDAIVAGSFGLADVVAIVTNVSKDQHPNAVRVIGLVIVALAASVAFLWRRRYPLVVLAIVVVGYPIASAIDHRLLFTQRTGVQVLFVVYAIASWSRRHRWNVVACVFLAALAALTARDTGGVVAIVSLPVALVGAPWFAGYSARSRRRQLALVEAQLAAAEADREARARVAVFDERARISRELHDVVAHHVSLIGVQAGAARTKLGSDADGARLALMGIEASSREAVREMHQLLDVLDGGAGAVLPAPPRSAEFMALCRGYGAAGLTVEGSALGVVDGLPPLLLLTLYRIVEEALTNVTRHSQAVTCSVELTANDTSVNVIVADPGPARLRPAVPPPGTGRGLAGMQERVRLFGGTLSYGERTAGGFVVSAVLPLAP